MPQGGTSLQKYTVYLVFSHILVMFTILFSFFSISQLVAFCPVTLTLLMKAPANVSWFHCWMGQSVHLIRHCSLSHYDALISPECYHLACFSQDVMISSSGVWRAGVCPLVSSGPLWRCMAPGPAGQSSPPAHGHVVGELLIAHGSAITRGKKCDAGIILLKILWLYCVTRKQTICHV